MGSIRTDYDSWPWYGHREQAREDARRERKDRDLYDRYDGEHKQAYAEEFDRETLRIENDRREAREEEERQERQAHERAMARRRQEEYEREMVEQEMEQERQREEQEQVPEMCPRCGCCEQVWEECEACGGEGVSGHDRGEDCCPCLYPEDNIPCDFCDGEGGGYVCLGHCDEHGKHEKRGGK